MAIALHGPFGEDGTVQALLEAAGLAYTGSGVAASAIGMDKTIFKRICRGIGLPVVDWREVTAARWASDPRPSGRARGLRRGEWRDAADGQARAARELGRDDPRPRAAELDGALDTAFRHDTLALVETYVAGARDLEVAIIGDARGALELYGPGEIVSGHEFYDYAAKYTAGLVGDLDPRRGQRPRARDAAEDRARRVPGDRRRRVRARRLPGGRRDDPACPRSTRSRGSPRSASSRRCRPTAATRSVGVCSRVVELALARHAARAGRRLTPADLPR